MGIDVSTRRCMHRLIVGLAAASLPVGIGLLPSVLEGAVVGSASAGPCPGTEVVFARGTGEAPGLGPTGDSFVDALRSRVAELQAQLEAAAAEIARREQQVHASYRRDLVPLDRNSVVVWRPQPPTSR